MRQSDELLAYKQINNDVLDKHGEQEKQIDEKDGRAEDLEKDLNEAKSKLIV